MTGNRSQLTNFVNKFLGTVKFGNDQIAKIMGYGDYQIGNVTISMVYYVEGLGHNIFFVGQFCDSDLEVAFRKHTCFIRNLEEFVNQTLTSYYEDVSISHETSVACTPQQNGIAKAIAIACYTQNRSLIRLHYRKTPYELLHDRKPDLSYLHVFGALCYTINDSEDLGKLKAKADIDFDELTAMASEQSSSGPALHEMSPRILSSGLVPQPPCSTPCVPPIRDDWDTILQPLFDEYFCPPPCVDHLVPAVSTGSPSLTLVDQDEPSPSTSQTPQASPSHVIPLGAKEADRDIEVAHMDNNPQFGIPIPEPSSKNPLLRLVFQI
ncbi:retrovirus-related pol polyprotein from transposon TNT 1-94, partial [Tanacetum coccineum]